MLNQSMGTGKRVISLIVLCTILLTLLPSLAVAEAVYGRVTDDKVFFRQTPSKDGIYWTQLPKDWVVEVTDAVTSGGIAWYKVKANVPDKLEREYTGYIMASYVKLMTAEEQSAWLLNPLQPTQTSIVIPTVTPTVVPVIDPATGGTVATDGSYGRVTMADVMFRKTASTSGDYWAKLPQGWVLEILGSTTKNGTLWYKVQGGTPSKPDNTYTGYIHSGYFQVITDGSIVNPTATPTPASSGGTVPSDGKLRGIVTATSTNLRVTAGGTSLGVLMLGEVMEVIIQPGGNIGDWYYVLYNGTYGFVAESAMSIYSGGATATPVPGSPTATPVPSGTSLGYVRLTLDKVNMRNAPGGDVITAAMADKLPVNAILPYYTLPVAKGGYDWVQVSYGNKVGYVRSDCYSFCDASGNPITGPTNTVAPVVTATPAGGVQTFITLIKGGVNVRDKANGSSVGQLDNGTVLPYYAKTTAGGYEWYYVYAEKLSRYGYIRADMARDTSTGTATATPAASVTGYAATSISSVYIRKTPQRNGDILGQVSKAGTLMPLTNNILTNDGYLWYPVNVNGIVGYVRGDCAYEVAQWQLDAYNRTGSLPTPTVGPTVTPVPTGTSTYIIATLDDVYMRETASTSGKTMGQIKLGSVYKFLTTTRANGYTWYKIQYTTTTTAWVRGDCVRVMSNLEYQQWLGGQPTATPTPAPTTLPALSDLSDLAITNTDRVKIRSAASMSGRELTLVYTKGTELTFLGNRVSAEGIIWYNVKYAGVSGWMHGDYVRVLTKTEKELYQLSGNPDAPREASYTTLSKGSSGEAVTKLQLALVAQGYLSASEVTGSFLSSTETAVINFQRANGLTVDGLAGEKTQHKLFNTVPEGTYSGGGSVTPTLYPVEKIDWYTGGIQTIWAKGTTAVITDVYTGISFRARRWSGGSHADVEPLTAADTAAMCKIYGVSTAQGISDGNMYQRRPLWVTIGGRTFAASMYGIPHNYPDGDTIPDNNFNGQFCVHFTNSKTSTTSTKVGIVDAEHQAAINYAYTHSKSGTK